jgi:2-polyprenyl-6-methoxyphenol hydroxylase-like FAD-dependent oxidoreductase
MNHRTYSEHQAWAAEGESSAVVIGGSLAGLLSARVLSDYFSRVTIVERDVYPEAIEARRGVPQAHHLHALLQRGKQILEQFFPGLSEELVADGAPVVDVANDVAWLTPAGWGVRFPSNMAAISFSRSLLDWHVRRRVRQIPNVAFIEGCDVEGLVAEAGTVTGVALRSDEDGGHILPADFVVDASGRRSRAPKWLESLGYDAPPETVINARLGYASRLFRGVGGFKSGALDTTAACTFIQAAPPHHKRGGIIFPIENGLWILTVVGGDADYPPSDEAGFLEFVRSLRSPIIYDAVKNAEPVTPVHTYRATENRRRHYEQLKRQPERFVVIGDAACAFNPVYGQGMSTAAIGAEALASLLAVRRGDLKGFASRFQRELARRNSAPWTMATGEDCRYEGTEGGRVDRMTRFMHGYMNCVMQLATKDVQVRRVLLEAFNLLIAPTALFRPSILVKVAAQALKSEKAPAASAQVPLEQRRQKAAGGI